MTTWLRFVAVVAVALWTAQAQDVAGDWLGTVSMPNGELRLALHISKTDGGLTATLDSVDQGVSGIPLDTIALADAKLTFNSSRLKFNYQGSVDAAATTIDGSIAGGDGSLPLVFRRGKVAKVEHKPAKPTDIDGDWTGTLSAGGREQNYLFHITNTEDGLIIAMDLPDQNVRGAEASRVTRTGSALSAEWKAFGSRFEGKIAGDRSVIEGTVTQADQSLPFTMKRAKP